MPVPGKQPQFLGHPVAIQARQLLNTCSTLVRNLYILITFVIGRRFGICHSDENIADSSTYSGFWFNWYSHVLKRTETISDYVVEKGSVTLQCQ